MGDTDEDKYIDKRSNSELADGWAGLQKINFPLIDLSNTEDDDIKCKLNHPDAKLPTRGTKGAAGWDLYAYEDGKIFGGQRVLIKTGLSLKIPDNWVGVIKDRSSIAWKHGIFTHGGVIDSDYLGDVGVILHNTTLNDFEYKKGDRIAQILFYYLGNQKMIQVDELPKTERGGGAYGSTGK